MVKGDLLAPRRKASAGSVVVGNLLQRHELCNAILGHYRLLITSFRKRPNGYQNSSNGPRPSTPYSFSASQLTVSSITLRQSSAVASNKSWASVASGKAWERR